MGFYTSGIEADCGIYVRTRIYTYTPIWIHALFPPRFFSAALLDLSCNMLMNAPTRDWWPHHHQLDTDSSSHLYCNAALQKGSPKHVLTERNGWLICEWWPKRVQKKKMQVLVFVLEKRFDSSSFCPPPKFVASPFPNHLMSSPETSNLNGTMLQMID